MHFTILDATIGLDPATLPADDLGAIRVTPAPSSRIYNKPADSSAALTDVYPAEPPLRVRARVKARVRARIRVGGQGLGSGLWPGVGSRVGLRLTARAGVKG